MRKIVVTCKEGILLTTDNQTRDFVSHGTELQEIRQHYEGYNRFQQPDGSVYSIGDNELKVMFERKIITL